VSLRNSSISVVVRTAETIGLPTRATAASCWHRSNANNGPLSQGSITSSLDRDRLEQTASRLVALPRLAIVAEVTDYSETDDA
jgi:hypothetical protein